MRHEQDLRERLASELALYAHLESQNSPAARAAHERIRVLEWSLAEPTERPPPPDGGNGAGQ